MKAVASRLAVAFALALGISATTAVDSAAQTIPASEAQAFLGQWNLPVQGDQPVTLQLDIRDADGQVAATVGMQGSNSDVTTISKSGEALTLRYTLDFSGQSVPVSIQLTPSGENLSAALDFADGMYTTNGTASRR